MTKPHMLCSFSCGASSAVATKIALKKYKDTHEIFIARWVVADEHPDQDRFHAECEKWFGQEIIRCQSTKYKSIFDVFEHKKFFRASGGRKTICSQHMKREVARKFCVDYDIDVTCLGYDYGELARVERFKRFNIDTPAVFPLVDECLTKEDCLEIINRQGIEIPMMYKLGFRNNNCIPCIQAGKGSWNLVRKHFPEVYERMAALERELNFSIFMDGTFLDKLDPNAGNNKQLEVKCSMFCEVTLEEVIGWKKEGLINDDISKFNEATV